MNPRGFFRAPASVLLVEDDALSAESLAAELGDEGYPVERAGNGEEALSLMTAGFRPAVIVLDLMMPGMSGWEFRRRQRDVPGIAGIPVIVLTGMMDTHPNLSPLAPYAYLSKPVQFHQLLEQIRRCTAH